MKLGRFLPRSLSGRTVAVLLAAVVVVHFGSMVAYRSMAREAARAAQTDHLAERLLTAKRAIAAQAPANRDDTAHALSSVGLTLHWSDRTEIGATAAREPGLDALRAHLAAAVQGGPDTVRLGYVDGLSSNSAHGIIGSLGLSDGSFVSFSVPLFGEPAPVLHAELLSTTLMAGGVAFVAILLMRSVGAPLRGLACAADAIGAGPHVTVREAGPEEVRQVARAFNAMQLRIRRLVDDRTHALAAVSHDLRTPITRLRLRAGFMADPEMQAAVDSDLDEMEAMIDATLAYLRGDVEADQPKPVDLAAMLATVVNDAADAGRLATYDGPGHALISVRGLAVKRAMTNLIDNALTYGGSAYVRLQDDPAGITVSIDDEGPGIPDADIRRMFEPFERLDTSRNKRTGGVGLGMTIARQAIERDAGAVVASNRTDGGLRVEVMFPRRNDPQNARPSAERPTDMGPGSALREAAASLHALT